MQRFQVFPEGAAEIVAAEGQLDGGLEEAELVAGVVTLALEAEGVDGAAAQEVLQGVGELDFAAGRGRSSMD